MPAEPSVTSACDGPRLCTFRYSSALLPKSFERPGPKSVSPATYCSGVNVVVWWRWIVDMGPPWRFSLCGVRLYISVSPDLLRLAVDSVLPLCSHSYAPFALAVAV